MNGDSASGKTFGRFFGCGAGSVAETLGIFGIGPFVGRAGGLSVGGVFAGQYAGRGDPPSGLLGDDCRAAVQLPQLRLGVEDVPVGYGLQVGLHAEFREEAFPAACDVLRQ